METIAEKERIEQMNNFFKKLSAEEQEVLIWLLKKNIDLEEANRLNNLA